MRTATQRPAIHGVIAQYSEAEDLIAAVRKAREAGYTQMDAYTPYAVDHLVDELGSRDDRVPWVVFFCGVFGAMGGFALCTYVSVVDYPLNIGGRPDLSWPSFIPITFECGILLAALGGLVGMLALNGLPRPHHPIFNAPNIEAVTDDKFFLCIESGDPQFEKEKVRELLQGTGAENVAEVAN